MDSYDDSLNHWKLMQSLYAQLEMSLEGMRRAIERKEIVCNSFYRGSVSTYVDSVQVVMANMKKLSDLMAQDLMVKEMKCQKES